MERPFAGRTVADERHRDGVAVAEAVGHRRPGGVRHVHADRRVIRREVDGRLPVVEPSGDGFRFLSGRPGDYLRHRHVPVQERRVLAVGVKHPVVGGERRGGTERRGFLAAFAGDEARLAAPLEVQHRVFERSRRDHRPVQTDEFVVVEVRYVGTVEEAAVVIQQLVEVAGSVVLVPRLLRHGWTPPDGESLLLPGRCDASCSTVGSSKSVGVSGRSWVRILYHRSLFLV